MLIEPQIARQLARISDTLEATALADMAAPYAQRQLKAGLHALRDLGVRSAAQPLWIREDIDDMSRVLRALDAKAAAGTDAAGGDVGQHLELQARLEEFEAGLDRRDIPESSRGAARRALRALYARMLEREHAARKGAGPVAR